MAAVLRVSDLNLAQAQTPLLTAERVDAAPGLDPSAAVWNDAPTVEVPLTAQTIVYPNGGGTIPLVTAQAVHHAGTLFLRLAWADETQDDSSVATEAFSDAAALMFPAQSAAAVPAITMGQADAGVNIWYWRADSQVGVPDRPDEVYEGALIDDYPLADDPLFYPARAVGNPTAGGAAGPAQNLIARGFGTLSPAADQAVRGHGARSERGWAVVLARSLAAADIEQASFTEGAVTDFAIAVWDGSNGDRNGQKSISQFLRLAIAGETALPAAAVIEVEEDGTDLALLIGAAVGLPLFLVTVMGWMYLVYGRKEG
ncbi:MAG: ethylbenzene dehydrogenase-related protein [Dehalococcoidia bacterium]